MNEKRAQISSLRVSAAASAAKGYDSSQPDSPSRILALPMTGTGTGAWDRSGDRDIGMPHEPQRVVANGPYANWALTLKATTTSQRRNNVCNMLLQHASQAASRIVIR
ncbi:hypothetical protein ACLKA6_003533 [Drosophila palustris]